MNFVYFFVLDLKKLADNRDSNADSIPEPVNDGPKRGLVNVAWGDAWQIGSGAGDAESRRYGGLAEAMIATLVE
jgi:hypothetical protein